MLEAGWIGVIVSSQLAPNTSRMLVRILFCKLMFMAGVVKIQSRCPTWLQLTALNYHFATQPLPTIFAWFAQQAPEWMLRAGVAVTLIVEIPLGLGILVPIEHLRKRTLLTAA